MDLMESNATVVIATCYAQAQSCRKAYQLAQPDARGKATSQLIAGTIAELDQAIAHLTAALMQSVGIAAQVGPIFSPTPDKGEK